MVRHDQGQYRKGDLHTNSIEGVWAQLKRQIIGVHRWVSPKHLDRYVGEMSYRYNRRDTAKGQRFNGILAKIECRLTYKALIA